MISGHYVAYAKDTNKDLWLLCNDPTVKKVDLSEALCDSVKNCYLLVYEAVDDKTKKGNDTANGSKANEENVATDEELDFQTGSSGSEDECNHIFAVGIIH
jgi:Ubiquitin carboxyl-terminal hydrolase